MRTTVRLDDSLLVEAKALGARTGRTLTKVIEDALRETLARRSSLEARVEIPVYHGTGGLRPGVDLDNSAALLDLMERDEADPA
ncbi:MAG: type II toxin-antitoxin system VapB family antitoxin [Gaiella sp.]